MRISKSKLLFSFCLLFLLGSISIFAVQWFRYENLTNHLGEGLSSSFAWLLPINKNIKSANQMFFFKGRVTSLRIDESDMSNVKYAYNIEPESDTTQFSSSSSEIPILLEEKELDKDLSRIYAFDKNGKSISIKNLYEMYSYIYSNHENVTLEVNYQRELVSGVRIIDFLLIQYN